MDIAQHIRTTRSLPFRLLVLATLWLTAACAGGGTAGPPRAAPDDVEALIGSASCDTDLQCGTIGVGAKACGGPARYLAWSSRTTEAAALKQAAERQAKKARLEAEVAGVMSTCSVVVDPGAYCATSERRCRLRSVAPGGAAAVY